MNCFVLVQKQILYLSVHLRFTIYLGTYISLDVLTFIALIPVIFLLMVPIAIATQLHLYVQNLYHILNMLKK